MTPRRTGFTLLELLVALTMAVTIAGSLAASLYIGYRARNSAEAAVDAAHVNEALGDIIKRDLANAMPPTGILASTFLGDTATLQFCISGNEPNAAVQGGIRQIELAATSDPDVPGANILVRRVTTNVLAPVDAVPTDERICRDVQSLSLRYYDGTSWYETWDSTQHDNTLPVAVELTLVQTAAGEPDGVRQTTLLVALPCGVASTSQVALGGGGM